MMTHPFPDLIDMVMDEDLPGASTNSLEVQQKHLNANQVVHGAVLYALADTGMGSALYLTLDEGQVCATIEIKMSYFKPVFAGKVVCHTRMINRGKTIRLRPYLLAYRPKCFRYSPGVIPDTCRKLRRRLASSWKPRASPMAARGRSVLISCSPTWLSFTSRINRPQR